MRFALCAAMAVLLSLVSSAAAESQTVSFSSLLDEMIDRDVAGLDRVRAHEGDDADEYYGGNELDLHGVSHLESANARFGQPGKLSCESA